MGYELFMADAFISHAHEDKDTIARPLAQDLISRGYSVWFDEYTLRIGDSLPQEIDRGLASCRFAVVILSPSFFEKNWTKLELDAMFVREIAENHKRVLPVWHNVTPNQIKQFSPMLASKFGVSSDGGLAAVVASIAQVLDEDLGRESVRSQTKTPRSLVLEGWLKIERAVEQLADLCNCFGSPNSYMIRRLNELGIVNDSLAAGYVNLRHSRDEAIRDQSYSLSPDDVERYLARVSSLVIALGRLKPLGWE
jgi:hypothetical protein